LSVSIITLFAAGILAGCSGTSASPDVAGSIRKSLDEAEFKDISVSQDREKGIVTLSGKAVSENDKSQAEYLAKSLAGSQVVADQIAVIPIGGENDAKAMNSDLDSGIEKNLDAALIQNRMHDLVKYSVKSAVVTLTGEINSQLKRDRAAKIATGVPNVRQVVNDLQVKDQKASSSQYERRTGFPRTGLKVRRAPVAWIMLCVAQLEIFRLKIFRPVLQQLSVPLLLDSAHE